MAEAKKIRIFKLASEINVSAENLIEFLKEKGFDVKSHMTIVTDEMNEAIEKKFKKDIEKAKIHKEKVESIREKISKTKETPKKKKEETKPEPVVEEKAPAPSEVPVIEPEEIKKVEEEVEVQPQVVEEIPTPVIEEVTIEEPVSLKAETEVAVEDKTEETVQKTPYEIQKEHKPKGLTVLGTIDDLETTETPKSILIEEVEEKTEKSEEKIKKKKKRVKKKIKDESAEEIPEIIKKKVKVKKFEITQKEVDEAVRRTFILMDESAFGNRASAKKKKKKEREEEEIRKEEIRQLEKHKLKVTEFIAVNELANLMGVNVSEVISKCISLGLMVSINQRLDIDTITLLASDFGYEVEVAKEYVTELLEDTHDKAEDLQPRPPVVTIMGHVDHGKTSLLDYIRRTNVVAGESGGITQHIGAYKVDVGGGKFITFLDTPGHEAFTAMRARGAQITDIVILIVAADDAVMPQTVEAISHALAANVPIIVAINKIDKPNSNIDKIKQQLADRKILVEEWGGKYQCVEISAKAGINIDLLLEKILLEAELLDLKANPNRLARGVVIESELDKGRGVTATVLVQKGTLRIGDPFIAGIYSGRVRAMFDERNNKVTEAPPATPVLVLGCEGAPQAGDVFIVLNSEREAKEVAVKRQQLKREQDQKQIHHITLDEISKQISIGGVKELPIIVKGDVDGSVEALSDSLMKLSTQEVVVRVIHRGVGAISESDVLLADASNAIIVGFHVRPNMNARKLAEAQKVDIRLYSIIYNAINEVKSALEGLLSPEISEEVTGTVEVREVFKISKVGTVAGCYVLEGKIMRNNKIRLVRDGIVVHEGEILALKRFKDDVREVDAGYECGISINGYNDIKTGDIIEAFKIVETKKKLS